ncbi:hypothetical protein SKAU_G00381040 [Synaphobranchus kaupii]|uniref:Uncharacterized protein n=1 Tax=Synaphobranchus kaupii TaxID=118154 RepID=A0A9Q1IEP5_SYNKA|nr:hypothetical protein SKAU_G00381040 [Synaphobranchus kaupii]
MPVLAAETRRPVGRQRPRTPSHALTERGIHGEATPFADGPRRVILRPLRAPVDGEKCARGEKETKGFFPNQTKRRGLGLQNAGTSRDDSEEMAGLCQTVSGWDGSPDRPSLPGLQNQRRKSCGLGPPGL